MPEPGPGEVLVMVGGAGACHSDVHILEMPQPGDDVAGSRADSKATAFVLAAIH